jgi:sugar phosphate isomerase/epimerase
MLTTLAALPAASLLRGQTAAPAAAPVSHLKPGLVAYSYRTALMAKKMTYEDVIHMASDWGLAGVDTTVYWFPDTTPHYLASLRKLAFKEGIQLYNVGARIQLSQPTKELQDAQVEEIKKWVDVADALGASHVRVFGGRMPKGSTEEQAIGWAVEVMKRGAEYSGEKGITLGVEDDAGLSATAPPTIAIAKGADSPWAGINADSGNLPKDGYAGFATLLPYATSIHFKTKVSEPDGEKLPADWPRLLAMIAKSGYRGFVGLEYEGNDPNEIPGLCAKLRDLTGKAIA